MSDLVIPLRTETIRHVLPARSLNNVFGSLSLPQNPGLSTNNYNHPHQDSYQSETVGITGPNSDTVRLIVQYNPYGFAANMTCNANNHMQMIALSVLNGVFYVIVFNSECEIISATNTGQGGGTLAGGYFFLNSSDNAVVVSGATNTLACYPTADVQKRAAVYPLTPDWTTVDMVELITDRSHGNTFFMAMPVWKAKRPNLYWAVLNGKYNFEPGRLVSSAYVAVVKIVPDDSSGGCQTTLVDKYQLPNEWCNNPPAVSEDAVFVLTNACDDSGACTSGYMRSMSFNSVSGTITSNWASEYQNSGFYLPGMKNIGSGTAPSLFDGEDGVGYVAIGDNAYPRMNVVVYQRERGTLISETPLFANMRSCDEASLIAVHGRIIAENNFGHTNPDFRTPQLVSNEPGMALVEVKGPLRTRLVWENNHICAFGMSMLARESGVVFAHTGTWNVPDSSTKGALYSMSAIDAWDGREIWRIPIGQGNTYCHEYGGNYFDRSGKRLFVGTQKYLVSIQNYREPLSDPK